MAHLFLVLGICCGVWLMVTCAAGVTAYASGSRRMGLIVGRLATAAIFSAILVYILTDPTPSYHELPVQLVYILALLVLCWLSVGVAAGWAARERARRPRNRP